jgi:hypothetical protein
MDDANIIFERDDVGFGKSTGRRKIGRLGFDGAEQVFSKANGIDLDERCEPSVCGCEVNNSYLKVCLE